MWDDIWAICGGGWVWAPAAHFNAFKLGRCQTRNITASSQAISELVFLLDQHSKIPISEFPRIFRYTLAHLHSAHREEQMCTSVHWTAINSVSGNALYPNLYITDIIRLWWRGRLAIKDCCQFKRDAWVVLANIIFGCTCHYHCKETSSSLSNPTSQQLLRIVTTVQFRVHPNS